MLSKPFFPSCPQKSHVTQEMSLFLTKEWHITQQRGVHNNSHKTLALVQWIRMWSIDSSVTQQRKHLFGSYHPLFFSWSNIKVLPYEASQAKKSHLSRNTRALNNASQKLNNIANLRNTIKGFNIKFPSLASFRYILSSKSLATLFPCKEKRNLSTMSISQSLNGLENQVFQPPPPSKNPKLPSLTHFLRQPTCTKKGKKRLKASSSHHLSPQNLALLPSPIKKTIFLLIKGHSFLISFQSPTRYSSLTSQVHHSSSFTPNFLLITCFQKVPIFFFCKLPTHLPKNVLLSLKGHLTPKPLFPLFEHTISHFTK